MKCIPIYLEADKTALLSLKEGLLQQRTDCVEAMATSSPVFVVWHGRNLEDPKRRINVVCFTLAEAELVLRREDHKGPMFIEVCSCARAPLSAWLLDWLFRCNLEEMDQPNGAEQKELVFT